MKKSIITILMFLVTIFCFSQKIVENKIDDFTKNKVIRSDWEKLSFTDYGSYFKLNKVDDNFYLSIKFITLSVCSINENDNISFLFDDGSVLDLNNSKYTISNYGDGSIGLSGSQALGFNLNTNNLSNSDIETFKTKTVSKIRIYTSNGYFEDKIKSKNATIIKKSFLLF